MHRALLTITLLGASLVACKGPGASGAGPRPYPLDTCIVTDNALGSMGDPITKVYGDQEVSFCCKPCVAEFEADQEHFLAKLKR